MEKNYYYTHGLIHVNDSSVSLLQVLRNCRDTELLEQEFLANKEKHLAMKEQVPKHKCPAAKDFDPER